MSDLLAERCPDPVSGALVRALPLFGITRALLRIGNRTWSYEFPAKSLLPVESLVTFESITFPFPGGTLSVAEPPTPVTRQLLEVFLQTMGAAARNLALLDIVLKTGLALSANLNLKSLLAELMVLTKRALGAEVGSVMLLDETKTRLYWEHVDREKSGVLQSRSLPVGEGIAGTVAKTGEPIAVADAQQDPRVVKWVDAATDFRTRSILCVPIRYKNEVIGVLEALNKLEGTFTQQDQELLELIAAEAGVAIENAKVYGTLEDRVRQRTRELSESNALLSRTLDQLKATQTQLVQSEKMAALGKLVAGVAHEVNTPLGAITSNTDLLSRSFTKLAAQVGEQGQFLMATLQPLLQTNAEACKRIAAIVKNLKTFARLDEAEWKFADLREGMDSTLALVHHLHKNRIEIVREYGDLPLVECHPGQINQVFMNLLVNAIQAIEGPGTIRVRMRPQGEQAAVEVQDTGVGIPEEDFHKIFDPGFTTKGVGVGTGLGLSICHQIVAAHHGSIQVSSRKGAGSSFTVLLPVRSPAR